MQVKIGVIHIQSGIFPMASYDFADAIVQGISKEGLSVQIFTQDADNGANPQLVSEKALKLFRVDKVDAIFTLAESIHVVEALENLASWIKKPIYIVSLGARLGYSPTPSGFLHFIEFDAWRSAWAPDVKWQLAMADITHLIALYEAGYQFAYAFNEGALNAPNALSPAIFVLKTPKDNAEIQNMFSTVAQGAPQAFYLSMSFKESAAVLQAYSESVWANTPIYVTPFVLNEFVNTAALSKIAEIYEISPINELERYELEGVDTAPFSMLGFEAGSVFAKKLQQQEPAEIVVNSPRGTIILPKNEARVFAQQYLYRIRVENGAIKREFVKAINDLPSLAQLFEGKTNITFSQWINPYLFA